MDYFDGNAARQLCQDELLSENSGDSAIPPGYRGYLADEKDYSPHTVRAYLDDAEQFLAWRAASRPGMALAALSRNDVRGWLGTLYRDNIGAASRNRKLASLRRFFKWAIGEGLIEENPTDGMERAKQGKPLPRFVTPDDAAKMIDTTMKPTWRMVRDKAILEVFFGSGLRLSELCGLDLADVDLAARTLRIRHGKGDKERVVPFGEKCAEALTTWLKCRPAHDPAALFVGPHGRMAPRQVAERVEAAGKRAGIGPINPHALRHGCATALTDGGASLIAVQMILGHSSVATTQRYVHLSIQQLVRAHGLAHPRAAA